MIPTPHNLDLQVAETNPPDAIPVRIVNMPGMPRSGWVRVALPVGNVLSDLAWLAFFRDDGRGPYIAVREKQQGLHSAIYVIHVVAGEETEILGELRHPGVVAQLPDRLALPKSVWDGPPGDQLIRPMVSGQGGEITTVRKVNSSPASLTYLVEERLPGGFWWKAWYVMRSYDWRVSCKWKLTWSDRTVPDVDRYGVDVRLQCGEPFYVHNGNLEGWGERATTTDGKSWSVEQGGLGFVDAGTLRGWCDIATLLDHGEPSVGMDPEEFDGLVHRQSVEAILQGPMFASVRDWATAAPDREYLAAYFPNTAALSRGQSFPELDSYLADLEAGTRRHVYDPRPLGLRPNAGRTGSQEAFGAVKNIAPGLGWAEWIGLMRWCFTDPFRGVDHRDADGGLITREANPNFFTWSGRLNPRWPGVDSLGKPESHTRVWGAYNANSPPGGQPWTGIDDQHRSNSVAMGLLAWTGDEMVEDCMADQVRVDECMHDGRVGAPRAVGRLGQSWAEMLMLMPEEVVG